MNESQVSNLYAALSKAQADMQPITKEGRSFFKLKNGGTVDYKYASTEQVIVIAKDALTANDLAFTRLEYSWGDPVGNEAPASIACVWRLSHKSGEFVDSKTVWPVIPGLGRPLDKALAAALTSSLGYALRDLLVAPREDEKDAMDRRDDGNYEPSKNGTRRAVKPATGKQAFVTAIRAATGITDNNDIAAFASKVCDKLGIDKAKATDDEWAKATAEVEANAQNIMEWAG
jgi:hypothetical protein